MKVRSRFLLVGLLFVSLKSFAALPGDKRTILTSGEMVHVIRYELGQSTVLYFGLRPETVICGNKNYFNIEKIKDGLTIQPLSKFSTNLTVLAQGRRYLFFLMPAGGSRPDGFVEIKWVPQGEVRAVEGLASQSQETTRDVSKITRIPGRIEFSVSKERSLDGGRRRIFEIQIKNLSSDPINTRTLEIAAAIKGQPLSRQVFVWEEDEVKKNKSVRGRLIVSDYPKKALSIAVGFFGKSAKVEISGGR